MTRALTAVQTLSKADPEFARLCEVLYGDLDPDAVYADVFAKSAPDQADVNGGASLKRRAALAATLVGTGLGVKELAHEGPKAVRAIRAGKGYLKPTAITGAVGGMFAGDILASDELRRKKNVTKAVPMARLVRGTLTQQRRLVRHSAANPPAVGGPGNPDGSKGQGGARAAAMAGAGGGGTNAAGPKAAAGTGAGAVGKVDDVEWTGTFSKLDDDKRLAFGWASVCKLNGAPVVDRQGDYIDAGDLEDAAYTYVLKSRVGGDMHRRTDDDRPHHVADLVESFMVTDEKVEKMGLPADTPRGWWVGFKVHDDSAWETVRKGERTGFSIHGRGLRKAVDYDGLMTG